MRETLRKLFSEIERLRNCTSQALKADEHTIDFIRERNFLPQLEASIAFQHVRANPPKEYLRLRNAL